MKVSPHPPSVRVLAQVFGLCRGGRGGPSLGAVADHIRAAGQARERHVDGSQRHAEDLGQRLPLRAAGKGWTVLCPLNIHHSSIRPPGGNRSSTTGTSLARCCVVVVSGSEVEVYVFYHRCLLPLSLQEIYGMEPGRPVDIVDGFDDVEGNECVICMSAPRDTTALPCRHMCMCHT